MSIEEHSGSTIDTKIKVIQNSYMKRPQNKI